MADKTTKLTGDVGVDSDLSGDAASLQVEVSRAIYRANRSQDIAEFKKVVQNMVRTWHRNDMLRIIQEYGDYNLIASKNRVSDEELIKQVSETLIIRLDKKDLRKILNQQKSESAQVMTAINQANTNRDRWAMQYFNINSFKNVYDGVKYASQTNQIMRGVTAREKSFKVDKKTAKLFPKLRTEIETLLRGYPKDELVDLALSLEIDFPVGTKPKTVIQMIANKCVLYCALILGKTKGGLGNVPTGPALVKLKELIKYTSFAYVVGSPGLSDKQIRKARDKMKNAMALMRAEQQIQKETEGNLITRAKKKASKLFKLYEKPSKWQKAAGKKLVGEFANIENEDELKKRAADFGIDFESLSVSEIVIELNRKIKAYNRQIIKAGKSGNQALLDELTERRFGGSSKDKVAKTKITGVTDIPIVQFDDDGKLLSGSIKSAIPVFLVGMRNPGKTGATIKKLDATGQEVTTSDAEAKSAQTGTSAEENETDRIVSKKRRRGLLSKIPLISKVSEAITDKKRLRDLNKVSGRRYVTVGEKLENSLVFNTRPFEEKKEEEKKEEPKPTEEKKEKPTVTIEAESVKLYHKNKSEEGNPPEPKPEPKPEVKTPVIFGIPKTHIAADVDIPKAKEHHKKKAWWSHYVTGEGKLRNNTAGLGAYVDKKTKKYPFAEFLNYPTLKAGYKEMEVSTTKNPILMKPVFVANRDYEKIPDALTNIQGDVESLKSWITLNLPVLFGGLQMVGTAINAAAATATTVGLTSAIQEGIMNTLQSALDTTTYATGGTGRAVKFASGGTATGYKTSSFITGDSMDGRPNEEMVNIDWNNKSFSVKPVNRSESGQSNVSNVTRMSVAERNAPMSVALTSGLVKYSNTLMNATDDGSGTALKVYTVNGLNESITINGEEVNAMSLIAGIYSKLTSIEALSASGTELLASIAKSTAKTASNTVQKQTNESGSSFTGFPETLDIISSGR